MKTEIARLSERYPSLSLKPETLKFLPLPTFTISCAESYG